MEIPGEYWVYIGTAVYTGEPGEKLSVPSPTCIAFVPVK
jgi:hypothetical protein